MLELIKDLYKKNDLAKDKLQFLLENLDGQTKQVLFDYSLRTKIRIFGDKVLMRGLLEFSNICCQDCLYCGLRASNNKVQRYRLTPEEILASCQKGYQLGYRTFVLQSGEDAWYTTEVLNAIIKTIKQNLKEVALTLSIGEREPIEYQELFEAGADRFLMRHETASRALYTKLHPTMNFDKRRDCLKVLKTIGYQVGAGFMVGLPGQTSADLVEDLCYLQELQPEMVGIGPFIPHSETPLKQEKGGTVEATLVMLALTRLLIPDVLLPATTALGSLDPQGRELALQVGANVVMPIITPTTVRKDYQLYDKKICLEDEPEHCRFCIEERINSVGFQVDLGRGDSPRIFR